MTVFAEMFEQPLYAGASSCLIPFFFRATATAVLGIEIALFLVGCAPAALGIRMSVSYLTHLKSTVRKNRDHFEEPKVLGLALRGVNLPVRVGIYNAEHQVAEVVDLDERRHQA